MENIKDLIIEYQNMSDGFQKKEIFSKIKIYYENERLSLQSYSNNIVNKAKKIQDQRIIPEENFNRPITY